MAVTRLAPVPAGVPAGAVQVTAEEFVFLTPAAVTRGAVLNANLWRQTVDNRCRTGDALSVFPWPGAAIEQWPCDCAVTIEDGASVTFIRISPTQIEAR